jgi:hypothetical protein
MKIRMGLVSNSSSSSFVLVGKCIKDEPVPDGYDGWYEFLEANDIDYQNDDNVMYVGKTLARFSDNDYGVWNLDFDKLTTLSAEVAKLPLPDVPIKVYYGMVYA